MLKFILWFCFFFVCLFITSHITWAYIQLDWQPFYEWTPARRAVHLYFIGALAFLAALWKYWEL